MIEIIETRIIGNIRAVDIIITNAGQSYFYRVGSLPIEGDLQTVLEAREAELWPLAQADAQPVSRLYAVTRERVLKALTLVVLDEINILRQRAGLPLRSAGQIDDAIKSKLRDFLNSFSP